MTLMTYRLPQYGEICYVYYDERSYISLIEFSADGYDAKIYFGDKYVKTVEVSKDSGANSEVAAYYENGNIKENISSCFNFYS